MFIVAVSDFRDFYFWLFIRDSNIPWRFFDSMLREFISQNYLHVNFIKALKEIRSEFPKILDEHQKHLQGLFEILRKK